MGRQEGRVAVPGGDVAVVDYGGTGADVVLVHSVGHCSAVWEDVAAVLAHRAHVVGVDLRGHGQSSAEPTDPAQIPCDLLTVVDTLGLTRPLLVGHDVSGGFAAAAAAGAPERIGALMLLDSPTVEAQETVRQMAQMVGADAVIDMLAQRFGLGHTGSGSASREAFIEQRCADNAVDLLAAAPDEVTTRSLLRRAIMTASDGSWVLRPLPEAMRALTRDPDLPTVHPGRELLARLEVPVCAVVLPKGRNGTGGEAMAELAARRSSVRVVTLDSGPFVLYTDPQAVAGVILDTAETIDGPD